MPSNSDILIEAKGVDLSFGGGAVLTGAGAAVRDAEIVTIIGPNGAGKTSLVRVMLGLLQPQKGKIYRQPGLRIGYVPQQLSLDPALPMTVWRFMALGVTRGGRGERRRAALEEVGAGSVIDRPLQELSGGELQRVLLARALLRQPRLLVLDEPVQGVDVTGQAELYRLIGRIRDARGCGVLMISHDLHLVMAATDHVVCLNQHVCCAGHPESVTRDPAYIEMFGEQVAKTMAVYHHHHDHAHDADGNIVPLADGGAQAEETAQEDGVKLQ